MLTNLFANQNPNTSKGPQFKAFVLNDKLAYHLEMKTIENQPFLDQGEWFVNFFENDLCGVITEMDMVYLTTRLSWRLAPF